MSDENRATSSDEMERLAKMLRQEAKDILQHINKFDMEEYGTKNMRSNGIDEFVDLLIKSSVIESTLIVNDMLRRLLRDK